MKKLVLLAALTAGFSLTANANELSDYLDSQYEITWAEETQFEEFHSEGIVDPLAAYQTEGDHDGFYAGDNVSGPVVDIAVMEIVGKPMIHDHSVLFVETYE